LEGDRLMVNKLRYGPLVPFSKYRLPGYSQLERGDIIVFLFPVDQKRDFIKRLIAFEGETVEIRFGDIYVNGRRINNPALNNFYYYNRGDYGAIGDPVQVPEGHVYVLGDNSGSSHDSRFWGYVPMDNIIGRAEIMYWPLNRVRLIK
jgi:signal peptidase I